MEPSNTEFINAAFAEMAADEALWITSFRGDPGSVLPSCWRGYAAPPLPRRIEDHTSNNYVVVSSFKRGEDGYFRRRKALFGAMHLVMVDDIGTKVSEERLALEPSALIETSPGNHQAWYFLNPPEADRGRAEALVDGLIASGLTADASDPGMRGVTRYGRLPSGVNAKAKYVQALGAPFQQRTLIWQPNRTFSVEQLINAFSIDMSSITTKRRYKGPSTRPPSGFTDESDTIVRTLHRAGMYLEPLLSISGAHRIICPWCFEHTDEDPTGTVYFAPSEANAWRGGFKCHHGHCQERTYAHFAHFLSRLEQLEQKEI